MYKCKMFPVVPEIVLMKIYDDSGAQLCENFLCAFLESCHQFEVVYSFTASNFFDNKFHKPLNIAIKNSRKSFAVSLRLSWDLLGLLSLSFTFDIA